MSFDHKVNRKIFNKILILSYDFFIAALPFSAYTLTRDISYEKRFINHVNTLYQRL